jgi:hypothetical protein
MVILEDVVSLTNEVSLGEVVGNPQDEESPDDGGKDLAL